MSQAESTPKALYLPIFTRKLQDGTGWNRMDTDNRTDRPKYILTLMDVTHSVEKRVCTAENRRDQSAGIRVVPREIRPLLHDV